MAIGALVIIGVVIDGLRRMHRARKESIAISSSMGADDLDESPLEGGYNPELPNGGARKAPGSAAKGGKAAEREAPKTQPAPASRAEPPNSAEDLSSVDDEVTPESGWSATDDGDDDGILGQPRVTRAADSEAESTKTEKPEPKTRAQKKAARKQESKRQPKAAEPPTVATGVEQDAARRSPASHEKSQPPAGANRPEAKEVVVINVLAPSGEQFQGTALKNLFEACGLEYGDLDIYHRHEGVDTTTPVQFSVASAVEPGTFRPDEIPTLSTPGISFFMSLPGPTNSMQAFDFMLETAQCVVRNMGGELKDERRSVMTPQTIEHCRQRIREFERKQRFART